MKYKVGDKVIYEKEVRTIISIYPFTIGGCYFIGFESNPKMKWIKEDDIIPYIEPSDFELFYDEHV